MEDRVCATKNQTAISHEDSRRKKGKRDPIPFNNVYCSYQKSLRILQFEAVDKHCFCNLFMFQQGNKSYESCNIFDVACKTQSKQEPKTEDENSYEGPESEISQGTITYYIKLLHTCNLVSLSEECF